MATNAQNEERIEQYDHDGLLELWKDVVSGVKNDWDIGMAFQYLILRAFELEGAQIRWPYSVNFSDNNIEQIDGVIHFMDINLSILVECKDYSENLNIEPIAKLRNQLLRRPSNAIGSVFSSVGFTEPAMLLCSFLAPQTILLWEKDNIDYCIKERCFKEGMLKKYRYAIEEGFSNFDVTIE